MSTVAKNVGLMGDNLRPGTSVQNAVTVQRMNAMMNSIRGIARGDNVQSGVGMRKVATSDGFILTPYRTRSGGGTLSKYPFDITVTGTTVTFLAGTINGFLPSNYLTGVTTVASGTRYLVLNLTASSGQVTAASFTADAAQPGAIAPYKGQPPVSFKILMGLTINGTPYKIWGNGNIMADPAESFRLDKASPVAGQLPYDIYYTWNLRVSY